ncbi:transglutaminase domain-containing protein [Butyrivibrio sp. YAB3001]|uniref:transglutaminase domain-containing protein n=1 Tax=Butyrivibrio sp. YAB3001 TaxID=1520812 RepID=UPI0008F65BFB|nr:transglutaminase domain-containing protein [Butyrivibrio sp. YAB3001]SFB98177.1 Transglutaminase-like superfamily protein [Butyrivibrio sp. YAB3001]
MKKLLGTLLVFILTIVVILCGFIVLCGLSPDVAAGASETSKILQVYIESQKEDEEGNETSNTNSVNESSTSDTSQIEDMISSENELEVNELDSSEEQDDIVQIQKTFQEYASVWNTNGLTQNLAEKALSTLTPNDEMGYQEDAYNDYVLTERNVIKLEDAGQLQEAIKNTSMGSPGKDISFDKEYYPYYYMLDDKGKDIYKQIYSSAIDLKTTFIPIYTNVNSDEWYNAFLSVSFDHPELFWLNNKMYTEYDYNGNVVKVELSYYTDELQDITSAKMDFESVAESIASQARELNTEYEKEVFIHNYLANKLNYSSGTMDQSAYSAIVGNDTVCAGYSKAFQYIMQKAGVPTYFVAGWGGSASGGGLHGWNMVKIGKDYYNVDLTWDDTNPVNYDYFNKSDRDFAQHLRMFSSQFLPSCQGKKYSTSPETAKQ